MVKIGPSDPQILWLRGKKSGTTKLVAIATSLEILKKNFRSIIYTQTLSYGVKIAKIAHGLCFAYDTKLVAMDTSLEESEKLDWFKKTHSNTFHLVRRSRKSVH